MKNKERNTLDYRLKELTEISSARRRQQKNTCHNDSDDSVDCQ